VEGHASGETKLQTALSRPKLNIGSVIPTNGDPAERFIGCFLLFIQQNRFTASFQSLDTEILHLVRTSPLLYHSALAIGALDASRRGSISVPKGHQSPQYLAFSSYRTSIRVLQASVLEKDAAQRDDVLWGTFFLGVFEVCPENPNLKKVPNSLLAPYGSIWGRMGQAHNPRHIYDSQVVKPG
jgi:hypothetical protein